VGQILGFETHEIPLLVGKRLLKPLGNPVPNAQKFFAALTIIELAQNVDWLDKATKALYGYWNTRNTKKKSNSFQLDSEQTSLTT